MAEYAAQDYGSSEGVPPMIISNFAALLVGLVGLVLVIALPIALICCSSSWSRRCAG